MEIMKTMETIPNSITATPSRRVAETRSQTDEADPVVCHPRPFSTGADSTPTAGKIGSTIVPPALRYGADSLSIL